VGATVGEKRAAIDAVVEQGGRLVGQSERVARLSSGPGDRGELSDRSDGLIARDSGVFE
jgi:hypothetical protein